MDQDDNRAAAALAAVDMAKSSMVLGLGTGSTAAHAVAEIGRRLAARELVGIVGVPTSSATEDLARSWNIPILEPGAASIDLAIDGADEIGPSLSLTKGGGGALLREKVIAHSSDQFAVIAGDSKLVGALGSTFDIPIEVAQFGRRITERELADVGTPTLRMRSGTPYVTDNGNFVIDLAVTPIENPGVFDTHLLSVPGVLATGIFVGLANVAFVAGDSGVRRLTPDWS